MGSRTSGPPPVVVHLDMDAFFASVEQRDIPTLRGKPVIVGGAREGRGIVSAASYEARAFGIRSGMSIREALRRCPHGVYLQGNWEKYVKTSLEVFATCKKYTPHVDIVSVDECTIRLFVPWDHAVNVAWRMWQEIIQTHHLGCSVGVAPNRLLAKLASSMNKPRGFSILAPGDLPHRIAHLPVDQVWGIGPRTASRLQSLGIATIGDLLAQWSVLSSWGGPHATRILSALRGEPDGEEEPPREHSMGHEYTFGHDVHPGTEFWGVVRRLSDQVSRRLRIEKLQGKVVRVKLRWSHFETHTKQISISTDLQNPSILFMIAKDLLTQMLNYQRKIRLVGVSVAKLHHDPTLSFSDELFGQYKRERDLLRAIDEVWDRYGEDSLVRGSILLATAPASAQRAPFV